MKRILLGLVLFFLFSSTSFSCEIKKQGLEGGYILKINTPDSNLLENCYKEFIKKETAKGQKAFVMMQSTAYQNEAIIYSSKYNLGDAKENAFFLCHSTFIYDRNPGSGVANQCRIIKRDDNIVAETRFDTKKIVVEKSENEERKRNITTNKNIKLNDSQFSKKCEGGVFSKGYKKGTEEFNDCVKREEKLAALDIQKKELLNEEENKKKQLLAEKQKAEEEKANRLLASMKPEERRAHICEKTYGFKKGSDKFSECVYKILAADVELEKIELQKKLAEAQLATAKANEAAARANASASASRSNVQNYDPNVAAAMERANEIERAKILLNLSQALRTPPASPQFNAPPRQQNCKLNPYNNRITCF